MARLFKNGTFTIDPWRRVAEAGDLPQDGKLLLSVEQWRSFERPPKRANVAYGLLLEPGTAVEDFATDYEELALVAINFPKFTDGRGYSMAHKIRGRYGFAGELRATGDVLFDQLQLMTRSGFDAFEISNEATLRLLQQGRRPDVSRFYQPGIGSEVPAGTRPWARRRISP